MAVVYSSGCAPTCRYWEFTTLAYVQKAGGSVGAIASLVRILFFMLVILFLNNFLGNSRIFEQWR